MITKFKIFENIKKSGEKIKDDYFEENMWSIYIAYDDKIKIKFKRYNYNFGTKTFVNRENSLKNLLLRKNKYIIDIFKKNNVDYRTYYWIEERGFYYFLNEENRKKLDNVIFKYDDIYIRTVPKYFKYPNDIEVNTILPKNKKDFELLSQTVKYNL